MNATTLADGATEYPDAGIGIDEWAIPAQLVDHRGDFIHQCVDSSGAILEEGACRHPPTTPTSFFMDPGPATAVEVGAADGEHVVGEFDPEITSFDQHHPLTGAISDPDRDLVCLAEIAVYEELLDPSIDRSTTFGHDHVVGGSPAVAGPPRYDGSPHGGASMIVDE